jgi:hypothetical protein
LLVLDSTPGLLEFTCSVENDGLLVFEAEEEDMSVHKRLQTLRLLDHSSTQFLPLVRLPALQNLHLSVGPVNIAQFIPFITHSSASLRRFSTSVRIPALSMRCFTIMSSLTDIELFAPDQNFLSMFLPSLDRTKASVQQFLPHLQSLALVSCEFSIRFLFPLLSSRRAAARNGLEDLQSFRWTWPPGTYLFLDEPKVDALRGFVAGGMKIFIGHEGRKIQI